jgi:hypothetical protein
MRTFGKNTRPAKKAAREPFRLVVDRDGVDETHEFTAIPRISVGEMMTAMAAQSGDTMGAVRGIIRMIRRNLVNDDGVPAQWVLEEMEVSNSPAEQAVQVTTLADATDIAVTPWPTEGGTLERTDLEPGFRGPDGHIYPMSDEAAIKRFTAIENGSSRRRWVYLIEEDDDATVEAEDITEIGTWLIGLATNRPTEPSGH